MEPAATFFAGAMLGMAISRYKAASEPLPPPPPPMPPPSFGQPAVRARIFYQMKEIPLTADGEDSRIAPKGVPRISQRDIADVVLRKAPARLTVDQKREAFFKPQSAIHVELLSRFKQRS